MKKMLILFALTMIFIAGCGQKTADVEEGIDFEVELNRLVNETNVLLEQSYVAGATRIAEECNIILNSIETGETRLLRNPDNTLRLVEIIETNEVEELNITETSKVETK